MIFAAIRLYAFRVNRRALAEIERSRLEHHHIGDASHFTAERVYFKDEVTLAGAAYRRVAGHIRHGVERQGEKHRVDAESCRRERRLDTRVSRADDRDLRFVHYLY